MDKSELVKFRNLISMINRGKKTLQKRGIKKDSKFRVTNDEQIIIELFNHKYSIILIKCRMQYGFEKYYISGMYVNGTTIDKILDHSILRENIGEVYNGTVSDLLSQLWDHLPENFKNILIWEMNSVF
jgi:hypothetical protein